MLRVALPNKGSLSQKSLELIQEAGYKLRRYDKELFLLDKENQVEFFFLRPKDIATYVEAGNFDFGITGKDILANNPKNVETVLELNFAHSSFFFIGPKNFKFSSFKDFENKKIASSYPKIVKEFLKKHKINANLISLDGAVEAAILLGIADIIADVVETGATIRQAGLKTLATPLLKSQAILIKTKTHKEKHEDFIKILKSVLLARCYSMLEYNIQDHLLERACSCFKGIKSPTITPLRKKGWHAVKIMIENDKLRQTTLELSKLGAREIYASKIHFFHL